MIIKRIFFIKSLVNRFCCRKAKILKKSFMKNYFLSTTRATIYVG